MKHLIWLPPPGRSWDSLQFVSATKNPNRVRISICLFSHDLSFLTLRLVTSLHAIHAIEMCTSCGVSHQNYH